MAHRCACAARTSSASRWSSGSRPSSSCTTTRSWAPARVVTTRTMNSMATACRSDIPPREQNRNSNADRRGTRMRRQKDSLVATALAGLLVGFVGISAAQPTNEDVTYKAELSPLNAKTTGSDASGEATFMISGDRLTIRVTAKGVPPNMEHLQHFHGFAKGDRISRCPTAGDDKNGDGIIDIVEPESVAGTTMVPFDDDPIGMSAVNDTFP